VLFCRTSDTLSLPFIFPTFKSPPNPLPTYKTTTPLLFQHAHFIMSNTEAPKEPAWHEHLPAPKNTAPDAITRQDLLAWFSKNPSPKDFVLVDLRRTDYQGGTIHSSINLPAQSLYHTIPSLYGIFKAAGVGAVIWYCGRSSSI
jgi:hypothetical protein